MRTRQIVSCILAWGLLGGAAWAQVVNPTLVEFVSPDHSVVTRYELGYFAGGATAPTQTVSLAKAEWTAQDNYWRHALPRPALGTWTLKARAYAPDASAPGAELASPWSDATGPFVLSPSAPAGVRVQP